MYAASAAQDYERAARLRDDIGALNRAMEKQQVVLGDGTDADVIALVRGPARGRRADLLRARRPDPRPARLGGRQGRRRRHRRPGASASCSSCTTGSSATRSRARCWSRRCPRTPPALEQWLSDLRGAPGRDPGAAARRQEGAAGDRRPATRCRRSALHKTKRASDLTTRNRALEEIQVGARACRRRRCGSSATTSPTCRAPRWSPRWWSSRTGWPARASTAAS